jgi:hypothetical protein
LFFLVFALTGAFVSLSNNQHGLIDAGGALFINTRLNNIYCMCDLLSNWVALFAVILIAIAIIGA